MSSWNLWEPAILEALAVWPMSGKREPGRSVMLLIWAILGQFWTLTGLQSESVWTTSQPHRARSNVSSILYSTQKVRRIHREGQSLWYSGSHSRLRRSLAQNPRSVSGPRHRRDRNHQQDQLFNHRIWWTVGRLRRSKSGGSLQELRAGQHYGFDLGQVCEDERKQGQCQRHDS